MICSLGLQTTTPLRIDGHSCTKRIYCTYMTYFDQSLERAVFGHLNSPVVL